MCCIDALFLQLARLPRKDVLVDEVLKLLVRRVDTQLLKRVGLCGNGGREVVVNVVIVVFTLVIG